MTSPPETSQAAQGALATIMARDVDQAWHLINPADLESSITQFKVAIAALVRKYGLASGALAAQFYDEQRHAAGITSRYSLKLAEPPQIEQVDKAIGWATRGVWQPEPLLESAKTQAEGAAQKMVLDTGRLTVIDTARADPKAKGWARITSPGCCYFCAMLATRGAVYKENTVGFQAHDHDRCHAEPVFNAYEPTAQVRQWQSEWQHVTAGNQNQMLAWRQHFEDRTPVA